MPRKPGAFTEGKSTPLAVRLPNELHAKLHAHCETMGLDVAAWLRGTIEKALGSSTSPFTLGWEEGRRAGWSVANKAFMGALRNAAAKLENEKP